jgi:competence protein ComEC
MRDQIADLKPPQRAKNARWGPRPVRAPFFLMYVARAFRPAVLAGLFGVVLAAQTPANKSLQIYVTDVEGGNATLFVTPSGESVLIDTGNPGARDADRIAAAAKAAGLQQIDHAITTHWHGDHYGGMPDVAARIPIRHFVDHGPTIEPQARSTEFLSTAYPALYAKGKHTVVKAGDKLAVAGVDWRIVTARGQAIAENLPGGGAANPYCASFTQQAVDKTENAASVGSVITFGTFRVVHLGDLTQNKEFELMCPTNRIGTVDLFIVSHHGLSVSNADVLVHAIAPRAAIMNNGIRKGAHPPVMKTVLSAPRIQQLWMLHLSQTSGKEYPPPEPLVANLEPETHEGSAFWIKVVAQPDGSFTITNSRNGFSRTYSR